jgi:metal-responsive CopG/Arc/MetJ family transcriptional regulator
MFSVELPVELIERIDAACDERIVGRKRLIPVVLALGLDALPPVPERNTP